VSLFFRNKSLLNKKKAILVKYIYLPLNVQDLRDLANPIILYLLLLLTSRRSIKSPIKINYVAQPIKIVAEIFRNILWLQIENFKNKLQLLESKRY